ncbi:MAG TPA: hypothetical protein VMH81_17690 [Bryobacteraceae bacterium]|nr:hypothetical protein [Bryobacteraceae bacterium]
MTPREFVPRFAARSVSDAPEAESLLTDPSFRAALYREIHNSLPVDARVLLRQLLNKEIDYRRGAWEPSKPLDAGERSCIRRTWFGVRFSSAVDVQFLVGGGLEETLQYLREQPEAGAKEAIDYLLKYKSAGDFDDLEGWAQWRDSYFRS